MHSITTFYYNRTPGWIAIQVNDSEWAVYHKSFKVALATVNKTHIAMSQLLPLMSDNLFCDFHTFIETLQIVL